jgi:alkaline phosphatase D
MPEMPNSVHYYTYYRRQSRPEFRKMVATTPVYAIWDDHDAATDDVWLGPYTDKPAWKMPLFELFKQNWVNPGYGDPEWPGCWFKFSIGDIEFFMLDGRFYRTNPYDENPTMLGPVQKKWLLYQLKASQATFKVIASPVPWSLATKGEARDTWNGFKQERQEIFDFLAENYIDGVILLSADRHRSDAWRIERSSGYPLYEYESSRLTNQHVHDLMPDALFGYNEKQSFGLLTFDTTQEDPTVMYQIVSIDNEIVHSFELKRTMISHQKNGNPN